MNLNLADASIGAMQSVAAGGPGGNSLPFASSISPERRARLRQLRAEFEAAFALVVDREDRSSPAYRAADASYRSWISALDDVAMALLDDIDACEATCTDFELHDRSGPLSMPAAIDLTDIDLILRGTHGHQSAVDLIGAAPAPIGHTRKSTPKSRAMSVVGDDRIGRHWNISLGCDRQASIAEHAP